MQNFPCFANFSILEDCSDVCDPSTYWYGMGVEMGRVALGVVSAESAQRPIPNRHPNKILCIYAFQMLLNVKISAFSPTKEASFFLEIC
jgi:hypothetical protein